MFPLHSIASLSSIFNATMRSEEPKYIKKTISESLDLCVRSNKGGHHLSRVFHMMTFSPARYSLRGYCTIREISYCVWTDGTAKQWAAEQSPVCLSIVGSLTCEGALRGTVLRLAEQTDNEASAELVFIIIHFITLECFLALSAFQVKTLHTARKNASHL